MLEMIVSSYLSMYAISSPFNRTCHKNLPQEPATRTRHKNLLCAHLSLVTGSIPIFPSSWHRTETNFTTGPRREPHFGQISRTCSPDGICKTAEHGWVLPKRGDSLHSPMCAICSLSAQTPLHAVIWFSPPSSIRPRAWRAWDRYRSRT